MANEQAAQNTCSNVALTMNSSLLPFSSMRRLAASTSLVMTQRSLDAAPGTTEMRDVAALCWRTTCWPSDLMLSLTSNARSSTGALAALGAEPSAASGELRFLGLSATAAAAAVESSTAPAMAAGWGCVARVWWTGPVVPNSF